MSKIPLPAPMTSRCRRRGRIDPLFEPVHFVRYCGARVKIRLNLPIDGRRNFRGVLEGCRDGNIFIKVDGADHVLPLSRVGAARLVPDA